MVKIVLNLFYFTTVAAMTFGIQPAERAVHHTVGIYTV